MIDFCDTNGLLDKSKSQSWSPTQAINWSELARKYSVEKSNRGQIVKEFPRSMKSQ